MKIHPRYGFHRGFLGALAVLLALLTVSSAAAQLSFVQGFQPSTIGPGSVSTLQFTITNATAVGVRGLGFVDALPNGLTIAVPANPSSTCSGLLDTPDGGDTITLTGGRVLASSTCKITVDVTASAAAAYTNVSGALSSDVGTTPGPTAVLTVASDRPGVSKSFSPSTIFFGGRSRLTITFDNSANPSTANDLRLTDNLPFGMQVASPANATTTCTGGVITAVAGSSAITYVSSFPFSIASVAANSTCRVSVDVLGTATGVQVNRTEDVTFNPGFGTASCGKGSAPLTVASEKLAFTKSFVDDPVAPGGTVRLRYLIRNLDRGSPVSNLSFSDDLDSALAGLVAIDLPTNPCGAGSALVGSGLLTLSGGSLESGQVCIFDVGLQVPDVASGAYPSSSGLVTGDFASGPAAGSPASDTLFLAAVPSLTKTFVGDPVGAGGSIDVEYTITNSSSTLTATDVAFQDFFPVELASVASLPASGFCGAGSSIFFVPSGSNPPTLTVTGGELGPSASCSFSVTFDILASASAGTYVSTSGAVSVTLDGQTVTGNTATDDFVIVSGPTLRKEFIDDPVQAGDVATLLYTLSHEELAIADAVGIGFSDDLGATLSGLTATGLPQSDVCGAGSELSGTTHLTLSGGNLAPGETCSFSVSLQVPGAAAAGSYPSTTSAVVATVSGVSTVGAAGVDSLQIAGLILTHTIGGSPALPGGVVDFIFTLDNVSPVADAADIFLRHNLSSVLAGLTPITSLPIADACGTGSTLQSVGSFLQLSGGNLAVGESCTMTVQVQVPGSAADGTYVSRTDLFTATLGGSAAVLANASADFSVASELLFLSAEFTDDPTIPGGSANLRFTVNNLDAARAVSAIAFSADLGAAFPGLAASGLPSAGCGGTVSGTSVVDLSGGSLAAGASCSFDVAVAVPASTPFGTLIPITTTEIGGTIDGLAVSGQAADAKLMIAFLTFSKAFDVDEASGGDTVRLTFRIENRSASMSVRNLAFLDDLDAMLGGLAADGSTVRGVCGERSELSGTSTLVLRGAELLPGGSCTFSVELVIPESAAAGTYTNVTSPLTLGSTTIADPATDTLTVIVDPGNVDSDGDGVLDGIDLCLGTVFPEGVPTAGLKPNRHALVDADTIFDVLQPNGVIVPSIYDLEQTGGCSCEQIIDAMGLGNGHRKFGCSKGVLKNWIKLVN